jgi:hypothetical protein
MKEKKTTHGGARPGSGPKPVEEKRKQYPLTVLPSLYEAFYKKYGRKSSRKIEEMIKNDLSKISE